MASSGPKQNAGTMQRLPRKHKEAFAAASGGAKEQALTSAGATACVAKSGPPRRMLLDSHL
eukprot:6942542-Alexandrium_andersonii.AAC.1